MTDNRNLYTCEILEYWPDSKSDNAMVKVWIIHEDHKYEASHIFRRAEMSEDTFIALVLGLRDSVAAKIRRDDEEKQINLTP